MEKRIRRGKRRKKRREWVVHALLLPPNWLSVMPVRRWVCGADSR